MAYLRQLLLPAVFLVISTVVFAFPPPGYELSENLRECRRLATDLLEPAFDCFKNEFSAEMMRETRRLVGTSTCLECKHFCRRHEQISACVRQGVELGKDISNKSKTMIPFSGQLIETMLDILCENEDEMFPVVTKEEGLCFRNVTILCDPHLAFIQNMEIVFFCDSANPETDPLTQEYLCRRHEQISACVRQGVELGKDISNKSKTMIPFTGHLIDTMLYILCDTEDEMFPVVTKEEGLCFRNATDTCDHHVDFIHNMVVVALCDSANPDTDPFTQEYMCRKIADFLDCSKEVVGSCSEKIVKTLSTFKTKLFNSDCCAAYN